MKAENTFKKAKTDTKEKEKEKKIEVFAEYWRK